MSRGIWLEEGKAGYPDTPTPAMVPPPGVCGLRRDAAAHTGSSMLVWRIFQTQNWRP